jgi:probable rRNA maturation factor
LSIRIFYDDTKFRIKSWRPILTIIQEVVRYNKKFPGEINIIISRKQEVRKLNIEFLNHDYYTDVVTFNYNEGNIINGEIYLSEDTIAENAKEYKVSKQNEFQRVIIHGVLHLIGIDDKTDNEKIRMRREEDLWLSKLKEIL